jgi:hypothetical protein
LGVADWVIRPLLVGDPISGAPFLVVPARSMGGAAVASSPKTGAVTSDVASAPASEGAVASCPAEEEEAAAATDASSVGACMAPPMRSWAHCAAPLSCEPVLCAGLASRLAPSEPCGWS